MRNWNSYILVYMVEMKGASRLPMRNWNMCLVVREDYTTSASRLPMRNWNPIPLKPRILPCGSFQTTYEELKLIVVSRPFAVRVGFQTTYEELKQYFFQGLRVGVFKLPDYLWGIETSMQSSGSQIWIGFQTTYEELKLSFSCFYPPLWPLPDYLWGIETCI